MLTRKHLIALSIMPSIGIDSAVMPYPAFELEVNAIGQRPAFIEVSNRRFGHQMEMLFHELLMQSNQYQIILENFQIFDGKQTLGEIDFLVRDHFNEKDLHIELCVKFYIYEPSENELEGFVGPNHHDSLLDKVAKLKKHQFPLLLHDKVGEFLLPLGINPNNVQQLSCFKALVFVPKAHSDLQFTQINNECVAGTYIKNEAFTADVFANCQFFFPAKIDWILDPNLNSNWMSFNDAKTAVSAMMEKKNAPLVWIKNRESVKRMFIIE
jgi:hypothetical protein